MIHEVVEPSNDSKDTVICDENSCALPIDARANAAEVKASLSVEVSDAESIRGIELQAISEGKASPDKITAESLWVDQPALIFIVRRAGCQLCREHAVTLSSLLPEDLNGAKIYAVIKEVAPGK
jgi:hypothetical protein